MYMYQERMIKRDHALLHVCIGRKCAVLCVCPGVVPTAVLNSSRMLHGYAADVCYIEEKF